MLHLNYNLINIDADLSTLFLCIMNILLYDNHTII